MAFRDNWLSQNELNELQDVIEQVGVPEQKMDQVLDIIIWNFKKLVKICE